MTPFTILIIILAAAFIVSFGVWLYTGGGDIFAFSIEGVAAVVLGVALVVCSGVGINRVLNVDHCETRADEMHTTQRWGYIAGCRLKVDGEYVPEEKVRFTDLVED